MENNNNEEIKKRKPRLPKLQRKFVNLQEELEELKGEVFNALQQARESNKIDPRNIDFSTLSLAELIEIQTKLGTALLAKSKDIDNQ